jgi:hypothetical protein
VKGFEEERMTQPHKISFLLLFCAILLFSAPKASATTPASLANPGNVIYSTPGSFTATFTVTDNAGLTDPNPPTRTIFKALQGQSLSA